MDDVVDVCRKFGSREWGLRLVIGRQTADRVDSCIHHPLTGCSIRPYAIGYEYRDDSTETSSLSLDKIILRITCT